jgi:DNA-binding transcriptional MerR regulator
MLTIGQVASRAGLRTSAIRYYEERGLLPTPSRNSGKRVYHPSIFDRLAVIELAKVAGFELREIRVMLSNVAGNGPAASWQKIAAAKDVEIDAQMKRLALMKAVLAKLNACSCASLEECGRAFIEARSRQSSSRRQPRSLARW